MSEQQQQQDTEAQQELRRTKERLLQILESAEEVCKTYAAVDTNALYEEIARAELAWRLAKHAAEDETCGGEAGYARGISQIPRAASRAP